MVQLKQIATAIFGMLFRLLITVIMIMLLYRSAIIAYNFGYEVFADIPAGYAPGIDKTVTIAQGTDKWELARILEQQGVVHDAGVFYAQLMLSEYRDDWKAGVYELNTSMHAEEIISKLAGVKESGEEDSDS